ncbi:V-type ATP synthase subunit C [Thermobrachium celere]|uniref:V-type ATP synthase subunit C n=1 Tax=Thermobrachium celere DSM 8682 TaxID=941824 RepID=R7RTJ5_9CLOT|nr:V-type ATP synthase subunit C [Thermobrachium celere]CDF58550.1 V-type ATP synthase subunit C [Thermobrachium celere DSM 8682]
MDSTIFAQCIARIKVLETKMLDRAKLESLIEAKDFDEAKRILQDSIYSDYISMPSYEEGLKRSLEDFYLEMFKLCPVSEVVDIFRTKYDAHNIKTLVKSRFLNKDIDKLLINAGTVDVSKLKDIFKDENLRDLYPEFREAVFKVFEEYNSNKNPQDIDTIIDEAMFVRQMNIAKSARLEFLQSYIQLLIDIQNIKTFIRAKEQKRDREFLKKVLIKGGKIDLDLFISNYIEDIESFSNKVFHTEHFKWIKEGVEEYLKTKDLGRIEKMADDYLLSVLKNSKFISFGPEPVVAYIYAKENEIKILRIILTGKKNRVSADTIRERLRDIYV